MEIGIKYRTKRATTEDIDLIKRLMANNPSDGRCALSVKFCKEVGWLQPNGATKDMVARGYMLALARSGYITLPPKKKNPANPFVLRKKPLAAGIDILPINTNLKTLLPLQFVQVRRTSSEKLFNSLVESYHYLGYTQPVGVYVGDLFMSLIFTCNLCRVNPFQYLKALQENSSLLAGNPQKWMP